MHMQPIYHSNAFVTVEGNGRGKSNAYIAGTGIDVGADIFHHRNENSPTVVWES